MKATASNLAKRWSLPRPIIKSHPEEKWTCPWIRRACQNLGFRFNIFATVKASDFNFGKQLGFAKDHRKITPTRKSEAWPSTKAAPNI